MLYPHCSALQAEKEQLQAEKERLEVEKEQLEVEKEQLQAEKEQLQVEKERLEVEKEQLQAEKEALQAEIQALKLKQYWTFNSIYHLELEMKGANEKLPWLRCRCNDCRCGVQDSEGWQCLFRPWFLSQLDALGLSYQILQPASGDSDVHFHIPGRVLYGGLNDCDDYEHKHDREEDYPGIRYGSKLLNATYGSEDLKKLDRLFERLLLL